MKTIFVSIAAQDDEELRHTIINLYNNAKNPERVFVGVGLTAMKRQTVKDLKSLANSNSNIRYKLVKQKRNNIETLGIGKGRTMAASLYDEEDYMLQIDCHSFLEDSWDTKLISLFKEAEDFVGGGRYVITGIPPRYEYCCKEHDTPKPVVPNKRYPFYFTHEFFVYVVPRWSETDLSNHKHLPKFIPVSKVSPAFIFGNKDFAKNHGVHKEAIFYDEDYTQTINLFGKDFAFVFPNIEDLPVRHLDSMGIIEGHDRAFFLDYVNLKNNDLLHLKLQKSYLGFINDKKNKEIINLYRLYAKVDPVKGFFSTNQMPIPKKFRLE